MSIVLLREYVRRALIQEGRKDRYLEMFKDILPHIDIGDRRGFEYYFKLSLDVFKKEDRIIWFLKQLKRHFLSHIVNDKWAEFHDSNFEGSEEEYIIHGKKIGDKLKKIFNKIPDLLNNASFETIFGSFKHYFSLPIPKIEEYIFKDQTFNEIIKVFHDFEQEWIENNKANKAFISLDQYEGKEWKDVIRFPDNKVWILLNEETCDIEGEAMGHCGNTGNPRDGDRILSLRTFDEKRNGWEVHLTFILDKHYFLGEMKGRGNEKPSSKYHPYIIKLLELPIIKGIKGGGYLEQNNFDLSDIQNPQVVQELLKEKPLLMGIKNYFKKTKKISPEVSNIIYEQAVEASKNIINPPTDVKNNGSYFTFIWDDLLYFLNDQQEKGSNASQLYELIYSESNIPDLNFNINDDDLIYHSFNYFDKDTINKIINKFGDPEEIHHISNKKEYIYDLIENQEDIIEILRNGYEEAMSLGVYNNAKSNLESFLNRNDLNVHFGMESASVSYDMNIREVYEDFIESENYNLVQIHGDPSIDIEDIDSSYFEKYINKELNELLQ